MKTVNIDPKKLKFNEDNPRKISPAKLEKLVNSIREFPKMLEIRPIVVDDSGMVLGGNMRLKAVLKLKMKSVPVVYASELSEEEKRRFIVEDNVGFGEWDFDLLKLQYSNVELDSWGVDLPEIKNDDGTYTKKVQAPIYEPVNEKPLVSELFDVKKTESLIDKINESELGEDLKTFLRAAAYRHTVFNYSKIADFYAHSEKDVQELMERSALVIIDIDSAIRDGYMELVASIDDLFDEENEE